MGLFSDSSGDEALRLQLQRIERKLDLLLKHHGLAEPEPAEMAQIRDLMRAGKKIEAIKVYREQFGGGLAEAKAAVEAME